MKEQQNQVISVSSFRLLNLEIWLTGMATGIAIALFTWEAIQLRTQQKRSNTSIRNRTRRAKSQGNMPGIVQLRPEYHSPDND